MLKVIQEDNGNKGRVYALQDDVKAGEMTFTWAGRDRIIIDHTEVNEKFSGQGVGLNLLENVVDYARSQKVKVIPLCPFAAKMFQKYSELNDVLN